MNINSRSASVRQVRCPKGNVDLEWSIGAMTNRSLLVDLGLAMLIALPAIAPAEISPRTVEPAQALATQSAEPDTLVQAFEPRGAELPANEGVGL
jgi:hypothetical protein